MLGLVDSDSFLSDNGWLGGEQFDKDGLSENLEAKSLTDSDRPVERLFSKQKQKPMPCFNSGQRLQSSKLQLGMSRE